VDVPIVPALDRLLRQAAHLRAKQGMKTKRRAHGRR
jgi:hypothetical protein